MGGWTTAEEFIENACNNTEAVVAAATEAGEPDGFTFMKKYGAWQDDSALYPYGSYKLEVAIDDAWQFDDATGAYFEGEEGDTYSYKTYKAQTLNGIKTTAYKGFKPDKISKGGLCDLYSTFLEAKGQEPMPSWQEIPEYEEKAAGDLVLTSYKVAQQTHSRTQNCKYLSELYNKNPAWINTKTAAGLGLKDGDSIKITNAKLSDQETEQGFITTEVRLTDQVVEGVIAVSHHCGHWNYGRYATADQDISPLSGETERKKLAEEDPDLGLIFWKGTKPTSPWAGPAPQGVHPNWIIPNSPDPVSGQIRVFDTIVTVAKA